MIHVCFSIYDKAGHYSKFTGTTMLSLFENSNTPPPSTTVHILHDNTLTQDNREKFIYLAGSYGQFVKFYNVEELCADKISEMISLTPSAKTSRLSVGALYRLLIPQVLALDIDKCIYLDSDIIVNMNISDLWKIELGDKMLGVIPALAISSDIHTQDKIVCDGFVKPEVYFNSGVLLMNLKLLRGEEQNIMEGVRFVSEHDCLKFLDQPILNYCFALQSLHLPVHFNQFVRCARQKKEPVLAKIYHYTAGTMLLDMSDPFNRLWMRYFIKTPWFNEDSVGRLYEGLRKVQVELSSVMINLLAIMSGKTRVFVVRKGDVETIKKIFAVRKDEEIIIVDKYIPRQEVFESMNTSQGKKFFLIFVPDFPFVNFEKLGFVYGRDFINGFELLSEIQGFQMNSYRLIQAM